MGAARLLLIDHDDYSASVLLEDLAQRGFPEAGRVRDGMELPRALSSLRPDLVLFNHHYDRPDGLLACNAVKTSLPDSALVALAAAGPAIRSVRNWAGQTGCIDAIVQKPMAGEELFDAIRQLLQARETARTLQARAARMENLLPAGALTAMHAGEGNEEELLEAALLFTDIRRSSDFITRFAPRDFFRLLNTTLSRQASVIRAFEGSIVKYTGDGAMAVFRGMGRSYLAMRCAQELVSPEVQQDLPFGIGVAEGLVLAGLVGATDGSGAPRQYDVIGATVHLSARLCAMAGPSEVFATRAVHRASRLQVASAREVGQVTVRGFPAPVECVAFGGGATQTA